MCVPFLFSSFSVSSSSGVSSSSATTGNGAGVAVSGATGANQAVVSNSKLSLIVELLLILFLNQLIFLLVSVLQPTMSAAAARPAALRLVVAVAIAAMWWQLAARVAAR